ncbi:MAG: hypothetical protein DRH17_04035 [Deltaproteobacteria bacterium]|nr:MAG: hypothetical protein DRH17_04035 [Deltaproteobacteria bacterium]
MVKGDRFGKYGETKGIARLRQARAADVDYIRALSKKVFQQYGPYENILACWFESGITVTLLALMQKRPVGFVMLDRLEHKWYLPRVCELLAIAVEPLRWRLGIGDLLMRGVQRKAKELGIKTLVLHTAAENLPGQKLFKKHEFIPFKIKKHFYPEGQDALMMYKDIV